MSERNRPEALLEHDAYIRRLSRRLLRDVHEADDAVQQTWLAALEKRASSMTPLRAWLTAVLRNFARRARRQTSARPFARA